MPLRRTIFVNNEIYHIYNRGIDRMDVFTSKWEYKRALLTLDYYRFAKLPLKLSKFLLIDKVQREIMLNELKLSSEKQVTLFAFCLMPNHFHFLVKQELGGGVQKFASNFQNSYTRYYNLRHNRSGPLFSTQFKAVRIEDEDQLLHTSRYIHLNPYTSYLVDNTTKLESYEWSSLKEYIGVKNQNHSEIVDTDLISSIVGKQSARSYRKFVFDQKDYQRQLHKIRKIGAEKLDFTEV